MHVFTLLRFLPVCGKRHKLNTQLVVYVYAKSEPRKPVSIISIDMGKRCVAAGCSNTNADGVSLFRFPRNQSLRQQWNKQLSTKK